MLSSKAIIIGLVEADRTDHIFDFPVASRKISAMFF